MEPDSQRLRFLYLGANHRRTFTQPSGFPQPTRRDSVYFLCSELVIPTLTTETSLSTDVDKHVGAYTVVMHK